MQTARQASKWAVGQMDHALDSLKSNYKKFEKRFNVTAKANADRRRKLKTIDARSGLARRFVGAHRSEQRLGSSSSRNLAGGKQASQSMQALPFADLDADSVGACLARIERLKHIANSPSTGQGRKTDRPKVPALNMRRVRSVHSLAHSSSFNTPKSGRGAASGVSLMQTALSRVPEDQVLSGASIRQSTRTNPPASRSPRSSRAEAKAMLRKSRPFAQVSLSAAAQQAHWEKHSQGGSPRTDGGAASLAGAESLARLQASYSSESLLQNRDLPPFNVQGLPSGAAIPESPLRGTGASLGFGGSSVSTMQGLSSARSIHPEGFRPVEMRQDLLPEASVRRSHSKAMLAQMQTLARKQPRAWQLSCDPSPSGREAVTYDSNGRRVKAPPGLKDEAFGAGRPQHTSQSGGAGKNAVRSSQSRSKGAAAAGSERPAFGRRAARHSFFDPVRPSKAGPSDLAESRPDNPSVSHRHLRRKQQEEEEARKLDDKPLYGAFGQLSKNTVQVLKGVRTAHGTQDVLADGARALAKASAAGLHHSVAAMHAHAREDLAIEKDLGLGDDHDQQHGSGRGHGKGMQGSDRRAMKNRQGFGDAEATSDRRRLTARRKASLVTTPSRSGGVPVAPKGTRGGGTDTLDALVSPRLLAASVVRRAANRKAWGGAGVSPRRPPRTGGAIGSPRSSGKLLGAGSRVLSGAGASRARLGLLEARAALAAEKKSRQLRQLGHGARSGSQSARKAPAGQDEGRRKKPALSLYDPRVAGGSSQADDEQLWLR